MNHFLLLLMFSCSLELLLSDQTENIILTNDTSNVLYNVDKLFCFIGKCSLTVYI